MIARIYKQNRNQVENYDVYRFVLEFLTPEEQRSCALASKDFVCIYEDLRRQRIRDLRALWRTEPVEVIDGDTTRLIRTYKGISHVKEYKEKKGLSDPSIKDFFIKEYINQTFIAGRVPYGWYYYGAYTYKCDMLGNLRKIEDWWNNSMNKEYYFTGTGYTTVPHDIPPTLKLEKHIDYKDSLTTDIKEYKDDKMVRTIIKYTRDGQAVKVFKSDTYDPDKDYTVEELHMICSTFKIKGHSKMNKARMIREIKKHI